METQLLGLIVTLAATLAAARAWLLVVERRHERRYERRTRQRLNDVRHLAAVVRAQLAERRQAI